MRGPRAKPRLDDGFSNERERKVDSPPHSHEERDTKNGDELGDLELHDDRFDSARVRLCRSRSARGREYDRERGDRMPTEEARATARVAIAICIVTIHL